MADVEVNSFDLICRPLLMTLCSTEIPKALKDLIDLGVHNRDEIDAGTES